MPNDFYEKGEFSRHTLARAERVDNEFQGIEEAFGKLPNQRPMVEGRVTYFPVGGTADAYTVNMQPALASYEEGLRIAFKASNPNTGPASIDIDGLGPRAIKRTDGTDPAAGDINGVTEFLFDGTNFVLISSIRTDVNNTLQASIDAAEARDAAQASETAAAASETSANEDAAAAALSAQEALGYKNDTLAARDTAVTKAGEAAASANTAASNATAASEYQETTRGYRDTALTHRNAAEAAAQAAQDRLDEFEDIYLGEYPDAPTQTPNGNPIAVGMLYFDTSLNRLRVRGSTQWDDANYDPANVGITGGSGDFDSLAVNGATVWHAGNDGTGSSLDADRLDGIEGSQFLRNDQNGQVTGALTVTGTLYTEGNAVWHAGNFTPGNYLRKDIAQTMSGALSVDDITMQANAGELTFIADGVTRTFAEVRQNGAVRWSLQAMANNDLQFNPTGAHDFYIGGNIAYHAGNFDPSTKANSADLATVATSGQYTDLSGRPNLGDYATLNAQSIFTVAPLVENTAPELAFHETDTDTNTRLIISGGFTYLQAGTSGGVDAGGDIRLTGMNGTDIGSLTVRHGGGYKNIWHEGNFSPATVATSGSYNDLTNKPNLNGHNAATLDGLDSTDFVRINSSQTMRGDRLVFDTDVDANPLAITNNGGAGYQTLYQGVDGDGAVIRYTHTSGQLGQIEWVLDGPDLVFATMKFDGGKLFVGGDEVWDKGNDGDLAKLSAAQTFAATTHFEEGLTVNTIGTSIMLQSDSASNRVILSSMLDGVWQWRLSQYSNGDLQLNANGAADFIIPEHTRVSSLQLTGNQERGVTTGEGVIVYDASAGLYVEASNTPRLANEQAAVWTTANVTAGAGIDLTWDTETLPTLSVVTTWDSVGTYAMLRNQSGGALSIGTVVAGSNLNAAGATSTGSATGSGSWRTMGKVDDGDSGVFLRIS